MFLPSAPQSLPGGQRGGGGNFPSVSFASLCLPRNWSISTKLLNLGERGYNTFALKLFPKELILFETAKKSEPNCALKKSGGYGERT